MKKEQCKQCTESTERIVNNGKIEGLKKGQIDWANSCGNIPIIIYLNEEDRPKIKNPLGLAEWVVEHKNVYIRWVELSPDSQFLFAKEWVDYRERFQADKPISLSCRSTLKYFSVIIYKGNDKFVCIDKEGVSYHTEGKINNGKIE